MRVTITSTPLGRKPALIYTVHRLRMRTRRVTMCPFTGSTGHCHSLMQTVTFLLLRSRIPRLSVIFLHSLCCFFSTLTSSSCSLWGGRKPVSVPFMRFSPGASRRQLSQMEHLSVCQRNQITNELSFVVSYPADERHSAGQSALCRLLGVPLCVCPSAQWWDRAGTTAVWRSEISTQWGQVLRDLGNSLQQLSVLRTLPFYTPQTAAYAFKTVGPTGGHGGRCLWISGSLIAMSR